MGKYLKLQITANTLVDKGAVEEQAIYKSLDKDLFKSKSIEIKKDDSKLEIHSIMYMLNKKDAHNDWVEDPKVLEDACTDFMINGNKIIKHTHEGKEIEASISQLYIVPENHPMWNESKYVGAIANVIKFKNKELYDFYKQNNWETSIEGKVEMEGEVEMEGDKNILQKVYEMLKSLINKEEVIVKPEDEVKKVEDAKADETVKPEDVKTEEVKKEIDPMIVEFIKTIADEINAKIESNYNELKAMIEGTKSSNEEEITELKKSIGKSKQADTDVNKDTVIVKKSLLS